MKYLFALSLLFWVTNTHSQKLPSVTLDLSEVEVERMGKVPFSSVQVLDVRFDKSNVGCISDVRKANASRVKHEQAKASFPDSLHFYLPLLLKRLVHFDEKSKDTLVLLVKQFRLSDRIYNSINRQLEPEIFLRLSFSAYSKKENQLRRIFSVDEVLTEKIPDDRILKPEIMTSFRNNAIMVLLQKVLAGKSWQSTGRPFTLAAVEEGIQKRFQLPLFTDSTLKSGVYKTFQEFKHNAPSLINVQFQIDKGRLKGIVDSEGKPVELKNFWGACTGSKRYIVFRNELHELHRSDKSFSFFSFIYRSELAGRPGFGEYAPQTGLLNAAFIKSAENKPLDHWFFLNMDDEVLYLEDVFGKSSLQQLEKELLK